MSQNIHTTFLEQTQCYDGSQLCSHWIFQNTNFIGDAAAAFIGPAEVNASHMVDLVDVRNSAFIRSNAMLHVLAEHFGMSLATGVLHQRLLVCICADLLREKVSGIALRRSGDDLYEGDRKLSVSIAAASPVSACLHFGINIDSAGTPVPTKGLADYNIDPRTFGEELLSRYAAELASLHTARCKTRPIG